MPPERNVIEFSFDFCYQRVIISRARMRVLVRKQRSRVYRLTRIFVYRYLWRVQ